MSLQTSLSSAGRVYKVYATRLEKLNIFTLEDFLYHIPTRYEDFSLISPIGQVQAGETVTIQGQVISITNEYTRRFTKIQRAEVADATGSIEVTWFNQPFLTKTIHTNDSISLAGRVEKYGRKLIMQSPDYEILTNNTPSIHTGRLVPIYHETRGVSSKWLRRQIYSLLQNNLQELPDFLPQTIREQYNFPSLVDALKSVHFPKNYDEAIRAKDRLAFDELLLLQLKSFQRRAEWEKETMGNALTLEPVTKQIDQLITSLPFQLTNAQQRAIEDIFTDLQKTKPMNRLVQGDVGSGKTVVGAIAMYAAYLNGFQSTLMAPTEILAEQHYNTIKRLVEPFGVTIGLVTGSKKSIKYVVSGITDDDQKKQSTKYQIQDTDILVGTQALLSEKLHFKNLGLVIIDEQQRFGVQQRGIIRAKGKNPHLLTMTATPIPRTVALTMYGDLDLSYLNELPGGRKEIKTWLVPSEKRDGAYGWIREQINKFDSQAFIICPFIEESENMATVKAAAVEFERLQKEVYPDLKLGLLHGKLKAKEKEQVLQDFRDKKFQILVATPVVEVGIDIPNATVIMIEAAERFGLAQLHQLRGRVGRGEKQSYCLLFTEAKNPTTIERLKAMERSHIGAELAELDLKLRGPGDLYGTAQSGIPKLKVARFSDFPILEKARETARSLFPHINQYPNLSHKVSEITISNITPD